MMFIRVISLILFITISHTCLCQNKPEYAVSKINSQLLKGAEAVVRFEEAKYVIESPRKYSYHVSRAVTIFSTGSDQSVLRVFYNQYSRAEITHIALYDAMGNFIRKLKKSEIIDKAAFDGLSILTDNRLKYVSASGGQLPFTLEYAFQVDFSDTNYYPDWSPADYDISIEKATFTLDAPQELIIHTRVVNTDFETHNESLNGRKIISWTINKLPALTLEPYAPDILPRVLFSPELFQVETYTGSMSDWKTFGEFIYTINKDREQLTPEMKAIVQNLTKDCITEEEKIDTLYNWLQKNMRYVSIQLGIGGWQSFDAATVEKNKYGDCKALSTFMKGMLKETGIESHQVLIYWDENDKLHFDDFVSTGFNHMMLYVPSEDMWLECTSNDLPAGVIDVDEENKTVLLITPEGGKIATTPSAPLESNYTVTTDSIFLGDKIYLRGHIKMGGNNQLIARALNYYASPTEQREYFTENFRLSLSKLDKLQIHVDENTFTSTIDYNATLEHFGGLPGERYSIPLNAVYPIDNICEAQVERKSDFISKANKTVSNNVIITLPSNYAVEFIPAPVTYSYNGNEYLISAEQTGNVIHVKHQRKEVPLRLTPLEYKDYCNYYSSIIKANARMIILKKK